MNVSTARLMELGHFIAPLLLLCMNGTLGIEWIILFSVSVLYLIIVDIHKDNKDNKHAWVTVKETFRFGLFLISSFILYVYLTAYVQPEQWISYCHDGILASINFQYIYRNIITELCLWCSRVFKTLKQLKPIKLILVPAYICIWIFVLIYLGDKTYSAALDICNSLQFYTLKTNALDMNAIVGRDSLNNSGKNARGNVTYYFQGKAETVLFKQIQLTLTKINETDFKNQYRRYIGEEVELECYFPPIVTENLFRKTRYYWLFNNKIIISDRHNSSIKDYPYYVFMKLSISLIEDSDFGEYQCVEEIWEYVDSYKSFILQHVATSLDKFVCQKIRIVRERVELYKLIYNITVFYTKPTDLVSFFYLYHTLEDIDDDVSYEYTVNGKPLENNFTLLRTCSWRTILVDMLHLILTDMSKIVESLENFEYRNEVLTTFNPNVRKITIRFCMNHGLYGWHEIKILREYYNKSLKRTEILEFPHPLVYLILPEPTRSLIPFMNDTDLYGSLKDEILRHNDSRVLDDKTLKIFESNENKILIIYNIIDTVIVIMLFIGILKSIILISKSYVGYVIKPVVNLLTLEEDHLSEVDETHIQYDIFISHSEDDYQWVSGYLMPLLEQELGQRVCLPDRDFHPGENEITAINRAIDQSHKIIVILSQSYIREPKCYLLHVDHLILPRLYEYEKNRSDILFLRYENCNIPRPVISNPAFDILNWVVLPNNDRTRRLALWINNNHYGYKILQRSNSSVLNVILYEIVR